MASTLQSSDSHFLDSESVMAFKKFIKEDHKIQEQVRYRMEELKHINETAKVNLKSKDLAMMMQW